MIYANYTPFKYKTYFLTILVENVSKKCYYFRGQQFFFSLKINMRAAIDNSEAYTS